MILGIDASRANKQEKTGVEWYSYFLIQEFKDIIPSEVRVRLYVPEKLNGGLLPLPKNWEVRVLAWPFRFWTIFRFSWEMLLHKPDKLFIPANIIPFFAPKETFTTIHDIGFKRFPECYGKMERKLQDFGVRRAIKKTKLIFSPSGFTKKELIEVYQVPEEKIKVIFLGGNAATAPAENVLDKYKIKKPYLFYIGRLEKKKNTDNLIKAFEIFNSAHPEYRLVLAGNKGYGWHEIPAFAGTTQDKVQLLGWIPQEDADVLMQNAEQFLYPSLYEGFGMPILEAQALGVPIITSDCASMPEVAGGAAILVDPQNPELIADAIAKLTEAGLREKLIRLGRERAKEFSWEKCAREILRNIL